MNPLVESNSQRVAGSSPPPGSAFVVEVARYNDSRVAESCMKLNRHCEIRVREIEECEACYAARLGVSLDAECECLEREKIEQIHSGEYREEDWDE